MKIYMNDGKVYEQVDKMEVSWYNGVSFINVVFKNGSNRSMSIQSIQTIEND